MKTKTIKSDIIVLLIVGLYSAACNCHSPTALFTMYSYTLPFTLTAVPPNKEAWPYCLLHVRIRTNNRLKSDGAFKAATVSGREESREWVMVAEVVAGLQDWLQRRDEKDSSLTYNDARIQVHTLVAMKHHFQQTAICPRWMLALNK